MAASNVELQSRQRLQQPLVIGLDLVASDVVLIQGFIVVARRGSESPHDAFEVVLIFEADVFFDELLASRYPVVDTSADHEPLHIFAAFEDPRRCDHDALSGPDRRVTTLARLADNQAHLARRRGKILVSRRTPELSRSGPRTPFRRTDKGCSIAREKCWPDHEREASMTVQRRNFLLLVIGDVSVAAWFF